MSVEVGFWGVVFVSVVLLAAFGVDIALTLLLRETRKDLRESGVELDRLRAQLLDARLDVARHKGAKPAPQTEVLPPVSADATAVDQVVTDIEAHTAVVQATTAAERVAVPPIPTARDVERYMQAGEPVHDTAELDRWQPLTLLEAHGRRERRASAPEIQPELLTAAAQTEVLQPVEVPEGDDDPPQDEARVVNRRDDDGPPPGGRALTPFGIGQPQPTTVGYRYRWSATPPSWPPWRGVIPDDLTRQVLTELTRQWRELRRRGPVPVRRVAHPAVQRMSRIRADIAGRRAESGPERGQNRSVGGRHRAVTP